MDGISPNVTNTPAGTPPLTGGRWVSSVGRGQPGTTAKRPKIAIVGAGIAGLSAALDALDAGYEVHLFESSDRIGGKMMSGDMGGCTVERGGEIVDSTHHALIKTLGKVGIKEKPEPGDPEGTIYLVDRRAEENAIHGHVADGKELEERYVVGGKTYTRHDFLDAGLPGGGPFAAMHAQMMKDREALRDANGNWTPEARELDKLSAEEYLQKYAHLAQGNEWMLQALRSGYESEIGRPLKEMSALNMVDAISTDPKEFAIYASDEAYRIPGGAAEVMRRMKDKLESYGDQLQYHGRRELLAVEPATDGPDAQKRLVFHNKRTLQKEADTFDAVVSTLPPPALLKVQGLEHLGIDGPRQNVLKNLQYNQCFKITVAANIPDSGEVPWATDAHGKPTTHNGETLSDGAYKSAWTNAEVGTDGKKRARITFLVPLENGQPMANIVSDCMRDFARDLGKPVNTVFDLNQQPMISPWASKGGCYPAPAPGHYAELADYSRAPSADPRVVIAGNFINCQSPEDGEEIGYMNCAANSAQRGIAQLQERYPVVTHAAAFNAQEQARRALGGAGLAQ